MLRSIFALSVFPVCISVVLAILVLVDASRMATLLGN